MKFIQLILFTILLISCAGKSKQSQDSEHFNYPKVQFEFIPPLYKEPKKSWFPAKKVENEGVPNSLSPENEHYLFQYAEDSNTELENNLRSPMESHLNLTVYPLQSKDWQSLQGLELIELEKLLFEPDNIQENLKDPPYVLFLNSDYAFIGKYKKHNPQWGKGISFLTEILNEERPLNQTMMVVFEAITNDKKSHIIAHIPISFKKNSNPFKSDSNASKNSEERRFDRYAEQFEKLIDQSKSDEFKPTLDEVYQFIDGLKIITE